MTDKSYLSVEEVAKQFGVNPTTVYRLAQQGKIPSFKVGGQWRFSLEMLESWVADRVTLGRLKAEDQQK
jgi:excisionase family DNA binding protein